ncbi:mannose-6-phosphate isomerase 1 [Sorghum bicolor]|uniref:mannose-6-phosphate isomerase 1 n=1 Tax=Sorghum bicolor TaxID=4558 RepID=UPI000B425228|nr:mannose-6-phosphate isomerase 1 [Sorghum bicolor]|eukprot:XP_021309058.1 mannose-6-phosphate isomerase 1 [Sorghum bicolor]
MASPAVVFRNSIFLCAVLSVAKALSIQAHPDRDLAAALHALRLATYRDANHKPEMAVAVTDFHALCGFATTQELKEVLRTVPEVQELVGKEESRKLLSVKGQDGGIGVRSYLKSAFTKLITARSLTTKEQLVLSLEKQYPGDVGVLAAFFLNFVKLNPGEALYVGANEPHAYLSGECIECMATSDNVKHL